MLKSILDLDANALRIKVEKGSKSKISAGQRLWRHLICMWRAACCVVTLLAPMFSAFIFWACLWCSYQHNFETTRKPEFSSSKTENTQTAEWCNKWTLWDCLLLCLMRTNRAKNMSAANKQGIKIKRRSPRASSLSSVSLASLNSVGLIFSQRWYRSWPHKTHYVKYLKSSFCCITAVRSSFTSPV